MAKPNMYKGKEVESTVIAELEDSLARARESRDDALKRLESTVRRVRKVGPGYIDTESLVSIAKTAHRASDRAIQLGVTLKKIRAVLQGE